MKTQIQPTAHTPGPWNVYTTATGIVRVHGPLYTLATVESLEDGINNRLRDAEREANARLIAAAPELLAALENLQDLCAGRELFPQAVKDARAAILKAKGAHGL